MSFCTPADVRDIADISTDDMTDANLLQVIKAAQIKLNREINSKIYRENIAYIDAWHQNNINGSNTTFYLKKPQQGWYIGDNNNSGSITISDVVIKEWKNDETILTHTVSTIDGDTGEIVVSVAPLNGSAGLYADYSYTPVDVSTPDDWVKWACAHLAAALSFTKLESGDFSKIELRTLKVTMQPKSFNVHYDEYKNYLRLIRSRIPRIGGRTKW